MKLWQPRQPTVSYDVMRDISSQPTWCSLFVVMVDGGYIPLQQNHHNLPGRALDHLVQSLPPAFVYLFP